MPQVRKIPQPDSARVDTDALNRLEMALGQHRSREILSDACFEIIDRLNRFDIAVEGGDRDGAYRLSRAIAAIAQEIGLPDLATAARIAADCQADGDAIARNATAQRMVRMAEVSLDTVLGMTLSGGE
ncbi:hypothetical protein [Oceanibium sediminis]|uniref:hypothetical protein n=1 Tax=Oceanibium sediminis TaxID=2026339 RepID=UPI0013008F37|nr:hypothetical protein [Oceanibium sediminis]